MKLTKLALVGVVTLSSILGAAAPAFAADGGTMDSDGKIIFKTKTSITEPGDNENPDKEDPVYPEPPKEPNPGPLAIVYASNFNFGEVEISGNDATYYAGLQQIRETVDGPLVDRSNYIQVDDSRGTNAGWTLQVKQNGQFQSTSGKELSNATLSFEEVNFTSANKKTDGSNSPTASSTKLSLSPDGVVSTLVTAKADTGVGTWFANFGERDMTDVNNITPGTAGTAVSLYVPFDTKKLTEEYKTSVTWILNDAPGV